jgi:hypothetical protein
VGRRKRGRDTAKKKKYKKTKHWEYININMAKPILSSMFKTLEASNK